MRTKFVFFRSFLFKIIFLGHNLNIRFRDVPSPPAHRIQLFRRAISYLIRRLLNDLRFLWLFLYSLKRTASHNYSFTVTLYFSFDFFLLLICFLVKNYYYYIIYECHAKWILSSICCTHILLHIFYYVLNFIFSSK